MLSRTATGLIVGTAGRVGTSALAAVTGFEVEGFAIELAAPPEGTLPAEAVAGLALLTVPGAGFDPDAAVDAGFAEGVLAGLTAVFVAAALAGELAAELGTELGAADAGLATELVGGTAFGVCACFAAEAPVEACLGEAAGAAVAGLAGAGCVLWTASGFEGGCCAATGIASEARQRMAAQLFRFALRMTLYRSGIFNSILPFILRPGGQPSESRPAAQLERSW